MSFPIAAAGLAHAFERFGRAGDSLLRATRGEKDADLAASLVEMTEAKTQAKAAVRTLNVAHETLAELLALQAEEQR